MRALRDLSCVVLEKNVVQAAQDIGELQQLQMLYLKQYSTNKEVLDALASSLSKTSNLRSLYLKGNTDFLLHVSSPPLLLRHLSTVSFNGQFPDWISSLKHLAEISLEEVSDASGQVILDSLYKLPSLQRINLQCGSYDREQEEGELIARTTHDFPALSILDLTFYIGYPQVFKFEEGSMTKLETLILSVLEEAVVSIVGVENLKNLKEVKLRGWNGRPSLKRVVEELKLVNENRLESNQIKVVM